MRHPAVWTVLAACAAAWPCAAQQTQPAGARQAQPAVSRADMCLERAVRFVQQSDRYLHQGKLRRGMKGYGLTVMAGTKIERFDVEIVSVVTNWTPGHDVVLARLSGLDLDKSCVVQGMSGSPVFVSDGGKDKMIGAVAYAFTAQKEPLCGIQPIAQMLAVAGIGCDEPGATVAGGAVTEGVSSAPRQTAGRGLRLDEQDVARLLGPGGPAEILNLLVPAPAREAPALSGPAMGAMITPVMISGVAPRDLSRLATGLLPLGMAPMQAGGVGGADGQAGPAPALEPGSAVSVPLVTGDANWYAVGTVTEVIGDRVLAFGHSFLGEGAIEMPMGPAYVHTVISGVMRSFKLASTLEVTGAMTRDESFAIAGQVGRNASMIPLTIRVDWTDDHTSQTYRYNVCRHNFLTPLLVAQLVDNSATCSRLPPEHHTIRHTVDIDFGPLGAYRIEGVSSGRQTEAALLDAARPIILMLNNPYAPPPQVARIDVHMTIEPAESVARILELTLDGPTYRPGETVRGVAVLQPFRAPRQTLAVGFDLPGDLPEGRYTLTACDSQHVLSLLREERPQRFEPRTAGQLLAALRYVGQPNAGKLYLRLPLARRGLAVAHQELPDLPDSKARILAESDRLDTRPLGQSLIRNVVSPYVLEGVAAASFEVRIHPREDLMRQQRNQDQ